MPWIIAGGALLGGVGGGAMGGLFGSSGAKKQANAMMAAIAEQRRQYEETKGRLAPYTQFGGEQLNELSNWMKDPSKQPMNYLDPGYEFRRSEGMKGVTGNAGTAGLLQSGDTLRAIQKYGQDYSSSEYGNAFNRWLGEGAFRQDLAGMGQSAAANLGYMGGNSANAISNLLAGKGAAEAGGQLAIGKSLADTISGVGGIGGNALARYMAMNKNTTTDGGFDWGQGLESNSKMGLDPTFNNSFRTPGGSDIFGYSPYMSVNAAGAPMEY